MKVTIKIITSILLLALLAGCALGPNYIKPEVEVPVSYKADAPWKEVTPQDTADKGRWWEVYGDPVLNDLEEQVLSANQDLRAALARVSQVRAIERGSKADYVPRLDLQGAASRERSAGDFQVPGAAEINEVYSLPLDLSYELDLWGRVRRSVEAASADSDSAVGDYQSAMLAIQAEVAQVYFALRSTDSEIALLEQTVGSREKARDLIKRQYENGLVSKLFLAQAETELANTRAEAIGLQKQRGELENGLAVLVGKPASGFSLDSAPLELDLPQVAAGLPSELLERRPDVAAAERQMAAASARIGVAKTAFFPSISLTGNAGYASADIDDLFNWSNRTWGIGPAIYLPIFDAGRNSSNLKRARAAYDEAVAHYRQQVLVAFQEVEDNLTGLEVLFRQGMMLQQSVSSANEALRISESRYQHGRVNYLEVVDSQRVALQAQRALTQLQGQQFVTSVLLIKALGGGWQG